MRNKGFTLVEILIVVIILGILAAIVIPQFTEASNDARDSALQSDLQTARSQLELFKVQHLEKYPYAITGGDSSDGFKTLMTSRTNQDGVIMATGDDAKLFPFGPYLQKFPNNAFVTTGGDAVSFGTTDPAPGDATTGWYFNTSTGKFSANSDVAKYPNHVNY
jgi:general secretion pathway protein G